MSTLSQAFCALNVCYLLLISQVTFAQTPFITTWKTNNPGTSNSTSITIPTFSGETYLYDVDWDNDGNYDQIGITGSVTHDYGVADTFTIRIQGLFPRIYFNNGGDRQKLLSIDQWGTNPWTSMEGAFMGCWNMKILAPDNPDLSGVTNMARMFQRCDVMNEDISAWDVSNVTNMSDLFYQALIFNQPLNTWDVSNVTNMADMFRNTQFNQGLNAWDVSNVTNMTGMFRDAIFFNGDITGWDVSHVSNMSSMFNEARDFNQNIGGWNVSVATNMSTMFKGAVDFDQDIGGWNVQNVTNMTDMFLNTGLSTSNYDSLLIGWSQLTLQPNVNFNAGNSKYCAGLISKNLIEQTFYWIILDGGTACDSTSFITTWKTDNPGTSNSTSITIPTSGSGYNYDVDWDNDGVFDEMGITGSVTHDYGAPGTYVIRIGGAFPRIYFNNGGDGQKLLTVEQWGNIPWTSMESAFSGCSNLAVNAPDVPDLSGVISMNSMFAGAASFNQDISDWDVSTVTDMSGMFESAELFNQSIGTWNTMNVTDMYNMFNGATMFNQSLNNWDVSQVTDMEGMFNDAVSFNGGIGDWNTGNVVTMYEMFNGALAFNQPIGNWDVSNVTELGGMFYDAAAFNQDIGSWEVGMVTGTGFYDTFNGAASFNQDISGWNVSGATNMTNMFNGAVSFDQDLGEWNVSNVTNMTNMFSGVTLSVVNYDSLLIGWSGQSLQSGVIFSGGNSQYCGGAVGRQYMIDHFGWNISDGGIACGPSDDFVTSWKTDNPGTSNSTSITIPTNGVGYSYDVDWDNDGVFDEMGITGSVTHDYGIPDTVTVRIRGAFPRIYFNNSGDRQKLLSVDQWGNVPWTSMESAFSGCSNLAVNAPDVPDLSGVISMNSMFAGAASFNQDISDWDVSNVTDMSRMFESAELFNQSIGTWNTMNVTNMYNMFNGATMFNQSLNNWDVSQVTDMEGMFNDAVSFNGGIGDWNTGNVVTMYEMFNGALAFNQPIGSWDVSNVTELGAMFNDAAAFNQDIGSWEVGMVTGTGFYDTFNGAVSFNQDISGWNVSGATNMTNMFNGAVSFDQDLGEWNVSNVTNMTNMFSGVTLSVANYDSLLIGWSGQGLQSGVIFSAGNSQYCDGATARQNIIDNFGWTITDNGVGPNCENFDHFVTTWKTDNPGSSNSTSITIPTNGSGYNYDVDWNNDGVFDQLGLTGNVTHDYGVAGTYIIRIRGAFPQIYFAAGGDKDKILSVDNWGPIAWASMNRAFQGCTNLSIPASDAPDLSQVTDMSSMFQNATGFNSPLSGWEVDSVTNMSSMFQGATSFNQNIDNWNVSNVTNMLRMFMGASSFNQPLNNWDLSSTTVIWSMFQNATSFNQPLSNWDVSHVPTLQLMFRGATSFNQDIASWSFPSVTTLTSMFDGATSFNQDISGWDVSNVTNMTNLFSGAASFDQNLAAWDMEGVTSVTGMFNGVTLSQENYDSLLVGWSQQNLTNNLTFDGGNSQYCQGANGRQYIIDQFGWTISDGGIACDTSDYFVTTWKTDNPGNSNSTSITIPTDGGGYNYDVDWNNDGLFDTLGVTGDITHDYGVPDTVTIRIRGAFPRIYFAYSGDAEKLISVDQWGSCHWTSMEYAFGGCSNLQVTASDAPDLSGLNSLQGMFAGCLNFNNEISVWDVSGITNMVELFSGSGFNQNIESWDVGNVTDMRSMFSENEVFNQPLNNWDVAAVTNMSNMFGDAFAFNQPLDLWEVGNVTDMSGMFAGSAFNQDISGWQVDSVVNMAYMFFNNTVFNQDISSWNVGQVTDMWFMFGGALSFDQPIGGWDVSNVINMSNMFSDCGFNQDISGWQVDSVIYMASMFSNNSAFDQNLGSWNVSHVMLMDGMFSGVTLSDSNYNSLLIGWSQLSLQDSVMFDGGNSQYCDGAVARQSIIANFGWTITDGGIACGDANDFVTTWKTDNPGSSNSTSITIPTNGGGYNYDVDWNNDGVFDELGVTGSVTHDYGVAGTYTIRIRGAFPQIRFSALEDYGKILSVDQWGTIAWTSMERAFQDCFNLTIPASDAPDLATVNSMKSMFVGCTNFNNDISMWDVSQVTNMFSLFRDTPFNQDIASWDVGQVTDMSLMFHSSSFNQDIGAWDVSQVTDMRDMFFNTPFDQDIGAWDVSQVTDMSYMFYNTPFNQDIGAWDVSQVIDMNDMFHGSSFNQDIGAWDVSNVIDMWSMFNGSAFNQDISNWNVSGVSNMNSMFRNAISFDQNLGDWNVSNVTSMTNMFSGVTLSENNYDSILIGWAALPLQMNVSFSGGNSNYCAGEAARESLISSFGWTITDGGRLCDNWWTGSVSSDWFNPLNWSDGVPTSESKAMIPNVGLNPYPQIDMPGAICAEIYAFPGTSVIIATNGELQVVGQ